jgi:hypothetical protein
VDGALSESFRHDGVETELDSVADVDERVEGARDGSEEHLTMTNKEVVFEHGNGRGLVAFRSVRVAEVRRSGDEAVEEAEVVGVESVGGKVKPSSEERGRDGHTAHLRGVPSSSSP